MMKRYNFDEIIRRENTDCVKYDLRKEFFGRQDVIPMWVADMDFRTPDFIIEAVRERLGHEILGYSVRRGHFYDAIAGWMKKRHNWDIDRKWITFSPGVVPAINMMVLTFTKPGEKILVQPPVYFPFRLAIENNGRKMVENPLILRQGRLHMDFDDLKKKADGARMMLLSNPHNPGGSVWTKEELRKLSEICLENDVLMVSDEIHSDLVFRGHRHTPLATLSDDVAMQTITCNAASKTFNLAGLATSYLIIPNKDLSDRYNEMLDGKMHLANGNLFGPVALQAAYNHGASWLEQLLAYVRRNIVFAEDYFGKHIPQIRPVVPESTYLMWLDCRGLGLDDDALRDFFVRQAGVGLNEGRVFGRGGEGFMRMNVACPQATLKQALDRINTAVSQIL